MEGIDYSYGSGLTAAQIKGYGKLFVLRYVSGGGSKDITRTELDNLLAEGLGVGLVWETTASRMLGGAPAGQADVVKAQQQVAALGVGTIPIYFAADWDASESEQGAINAYLDACAGVIGRDRTGLYGSYYVVKRAFDAGKCTFGWQTYAWSGGNWDARAQLQQYSNNVPLGPANVDLNRSTADDYGHWPRPGDDSAVTPPTPPGPVAEVPELHVDYFATDHNSTCPDVITWQQQMSERGWAVDPDGIYGPASASACEQFQTEKGLAVDSTVGPETWAATWTAPVT